jgi:hypothetical protein
MATRTAITQACRTIADAYGKPDKWAEGMAAILAENPGLKLPEWVTDEGISMAAESWCHDESHPPVAQELRSLALRLSRRPQVSGCHDCGWTGRREVLQVWVDPETGQERRRHAISACTCEKGREYTMHAVYTEVVRAAQGRPGFVSVTVTNRAHEVITARERMGEQAWAEFQRQARSRGQGMSREQLEQDLRATIGRPELRRQQDLYAQPSHHDRGEWEL